MPQQDDAKSATRDGPILVLAGPGLIPAVLVNALAKAFPAQVTLVEERPDSPFALARRRARRLGWWTALGQLATSIASRLLKRTTQARTNAILQAYGHEATLDTSVNVISVDTVNGNDARAAITRLRPAVIVTIACRLLTRETLAAAPCPIINFHAGINPAYRGQMGGYWALASGDADNFGGTIHLVDAGVDTGETLYEVRIRPEKADTLATYPLLLAAAGTEKTIQAVRDALAGELHPRQATGPSSLRFPPTLWRWIWNGLTRRVW